MQEIVSILWNEWVPAVCLVQMNRTTISYFLDSVFESTARNSVKFVNQMSSCLLSVSADSARIIGPVRVFEEDKDFIFFFDWTSKFHQSAVVLILEWRFFYSVI